MRVKKGIKPLLGVEYFWHEYWCEKGWIYQLEMFIPRCPYCPQKVLDYDQKYCSNCGSKINWTTYDEDRNLARIVFAFYHFPTPVNVFGWTNDEVENMHRELISQYGERYWENESNLPKCLNGKTIYPSIFGLIKEHKENKWFEKDFFRKAEKIIE